MGQACPSPPNLRPSYLQNPTYYDQRIFLITLKGFRLISASEDYAVDLGVKAVSLLECVWVSTAINGLRLIPFTTLLV